MGFRFHTLLTIVTMALSTLGEDKFADTVMNIADADGNIVATVVNGSVSQAAFHTNQAIVQEVATSGSSRSTSTGFAIPICGSITGIKGAIGFQGFRTEAEVSLVGTLIADAIDAVSNTLRRNEGESISCYTM